MIAVALQTLQSGQHLSEEEARAAFDALLDHTLTPEQVGALLMGLSQKGESPTELKAAVSAMRARMKKAHVRDDAIDVCGTGGDGLNTRNVSTAVALVVASCGVPVAKHGNRAASSASGSSDILSALGIKIDIPQTHVEHCVNSLGIGYLSAPLYHPALKPLAEVRKNLNIRTCFNILGPLCNPASVKRQMIGVADHAIMPVMIEILKDVGSTDVMIVHGARGMDELSLFGENSIVHYQKGFISEHRLTAKDFGLASAPLEAIMGGSPADNAQALKDVLAGENNAYRDTVLMNASAALVMANRANNWHDGVEAADHALRSGKTAQLLDSWSRMSHGEMLCDIS